MNSRQIRKVNTARVFHAIRQRPGISQTRLQAITGIDRSTVSTVLQQLEGDGVITRTRTADRSGMGRPTDGYWINADSGHLVGVSVERDHLIFVESGLDGAVRAKLAAAQPIGGRALQQEIISGYRELVQSQGISPTSVRGIGVAVPASVLNGDPMSAESGRSQASLIAEDVEAQASSMVSIADEISASAWAEHQMGATRGIDSFLFVDGGDEIRGALCLDGRMHLGDYPAFTGIGHVKVELGGRTCICGQEGCLQAYVSEEAILGRLAEFKRPSRTLLEVAASAKGNDALARTVLTEAGSYLGIVLANALNLLGLREVVLAGHLAQLAEFLTPGMRQVLKAALADDIGEKINIRRSQLGSEIRTAGSIALAMQSFLPGPLNESSSA